MYAYLCKALKRSKLVPAGEVVLRLDRGEPPEPDQKCGFSETLGGFLHLCILPGGAHVDTQPGKQSALCSEGRTRKQILFSPAEAAQSDKSDVRRSVTFLPP